MLIRDPFSPAYEERGGKGASDCLWSGRANGEVDAGEASTLQQARTFGDDRQT